MSSLHLAGSPPALRPLLGLCLALLLAACADLSGPEYEQPDTPKKSTWSQPSALAVSGADAIRLDWWRNFGDPRLDGYIQQALASNNDLLVLAARTGVAEAAISQANAARLPTVDAALGANVQKFSGLDATRQTSYATALSWEIDIWGKLRKGVNARQADVQASEAQWRAGYLTLAADVATTYFQILQFDEQLEQQQWSIDTGERILGVYDAQLQEGMVPKTQVLSQEAEVSRLRKDLIELQRLRQLSENALATLLGIPAGELEVPVQHLSDAVQVIQVPAGLPSELLDRRPDIVAAKYRVLQAYELEGQASLARLPSISLTSNLGNSSNALNTLLNAWSFGVAPTVSIPLFDPNVRARYRVSQAESELVAEQYRATVMAAFEEVENALTNLASHREQRDHLVGRRDKLDVVADQVEAQVAAGMASQLEVFEAERSALQARQQVLANHQLILSDTVELYKALGGGWPPVQVGVPR